MKIAERIITKKTIVLALVLCIVIYCGALLLFRTPSNDRVWSLDQQVLPAATFTDGLVTIKNIRNFSYTSTKEYTPSYYDKTVRLEDIVSVDYIVEPFGGIGAAHTLLSFGMADGSRIAISVEIRKEIDETFSPLKGLLDAYELMYVVLDERDALILRAVHRNDPIYIYPTVATKEQVQQLFVDMLTRANTLNERPEFYNTFTSTCTTNIATHINAITPKRIPWDLRVLLPKNSDLLAYELGLIDNTIPLSDLRSHYSAQEKIIEHQHDDNFSQAIRSTSDSIQ